jgi:protein-tyrosine phosphatase
MISRVSPAACLLPLLLVLGGCAMQPMGSDQRIPFTQATVAGADNHSFTVNWTEVGAGSVKVYAGTDPAHVGRDRLVGQGGATGSVAVQGLPDAARWYFELVPDNGGALTVADRNLHLATAPNFRDAGGYRTTDGKWVRMGLLYRSDQLDHLSEADLGTLHADGLHLVCDLRTDTERKQGMDKLPEGAEPLIADVAGSDSSSSGIAKLFAGGADANKVLGNGRGVQFMIDAEKQFAGSPTANAAYNALFTRLADSKMLPAVFHCTAGKDRTGWAEAVFLSIMGVPRETIVQDYMLSNQYLAAKNQKTLNALKGRIDPALLEPLFGVRPDYLQAGFDEIDKKYGSMDNYIRDGLKLDDATVKALRREFLAGSGA